LNDRQVNHYHSLIITYLLNRYDHIPICRGNKHAVLRNIGGEIDSIINEHLTSDTRIGLLNVDNEGLCLWGAIDIDGPSIKKNSSKEHKNPVKDPHKTAQIIFIISQNMGLSPYLEISGSGTGFHIWFFFKNRKPAREVKATLQSIIPKNIPLLKGGFACPKKGTGIEVFPKQDGKPSDLGNHVWAPFFAKADAPHGNKFVTISNAGVNEYCPLSFQYTSDDAWSAVVADAYSACPPVTEVKRKYANDFSNTFKKFPREGLTNVFEGCETARYLGNKGKVIPPGHNEGFAFLSIVSPFEGGTEDFCKNMKGWATNEKEIKQITDFANKYAPYSCKKLQDLGLCSKPHPNACMYHDSPNPVHLRNKKHSLKQAINQLLDQKTGEIDHEKRKN